MNRKQLLTVILLQTWRRLGLLGVVWAAPVLAGPATTPASGIQPITDRDSLVAAVLAENPSLTASAARAAQKRAAALVAEAWPDAVLRAQVAPISAVTTFTGGPPFGASLILGQKIVWPDKLAASAAVAREEAAVADDDVVTERLRLAVAASQLYDAYWEQAEALLAQREIVEVTRQREATAAAGYGAGRGSQQDPLQAGIERIHAEHELHVLERGVVTARARLNALLHRPAEASLPTPTSPSFSGPDDVEVPDTAAVLRDHPRLVAMRSSLQVADARVAATAFRFVPDVEVNATYNSMWPALPHQIMVGVALELPTQWERRDAEVGRAEAGREEQRALLAAAEDAVVERVTATDAAFDEARRIEGLLRTELLPAVEARADAALAGYQRGENSFDVVINAERQRYDVRRQLIAASAAMSRAYADRLEARGVFPGVVEATSPQAPSSSSSSSPSSSSSSSSSPAPASSSASTGMGTP